MLLNPTPDQLLFQQTTATFLDELVPLDVLRTCATNPPASPPVLAARRRTRLDQPARREEHGGGAVGEHGLVDLTLIAHEFGRHAAPGPLTPTNVVAAMLEPSRRRSATTDAVEALVAGTSTAAWCLAEPAPNDRLGGWSRDGSLDVRIDGDEVVLNGTKRPVDAAPDADLLLVTGRTGDGLTNVLVPAATAGCTDSGAAFDRAITALRRRRLRPTSGSRSAALVGEPGAAADEVEWATLLGLTIAAAESVGAMQAAFDMTVEWAFDRYSFGRPLASYQALKHRFADMKSWLEASPRDRRRGRARGGHRRSAARPISPSPRRPTSASTAPSWPTTASRSTVASASRSNTTCTCTCGASSSTAPPTGAPPTPRSVLADLLEQHADERRHASR